VDFSTICKRTAHISAGAPQERRGAGP
jgi:hypothetical protein